MSNLINAPEPRLELTSSDKDSVLWEKLKTHLNKRINQLRMNNDGDKPEIDTAHLRGRIAEIKALLALDKDS